MSANRDHIYLLHMLEFASKILKFTDGKECKDLESDEILGLAVEHLIELIGEAARNISFEFRRRHLEIPWELIIGTRDRIVHGYIDVDMVIIWSIISEDLPLLIAQLENLLKSEFGTGGS